MAGAANGSPLKFSGNAHPFSSPSTTNQTGFLATTKPRLAGSSAGAAPLTKREPAFKTCEQPLTTPMANKPGQISFQLRSLKIPLDAGVALKKSPSSSSSSRSRSRSRSPVVRTRAKSRSRSRSPSISYSSPSATTKKLSKTQMKKLKKKNQHLSKSGGGLANKIGGFMGGTSFGASLASAEKLRKRQDRFQVSKKMVKSSTIGGDGTLFREEVAGEEDWANMLVVGECLEIEKPFFRLTAAPDPSTVRPVSILQKALTKVPSSLIDTFDFNFITSINQNVGEVVVDLSFRLSLVLRSDEIYSTRPYCAGNQGLVYS